MEMINNSEILEIAKKAIEEKVIERLGAGYSSPLNAIIEEVIAEHRPELKALFNECLESIVANTSFKKTLKEEFLHKVAKNMVGKLEGTVEKAVDVMKQDQTLKARMVLAIENIINESAPEPLKTP